MERQKIAYAYDYDSKNAEVVSRVLGLLIGSWKPDYAQMEWVSDNDRYAEGAGVAPPGVKSQLASGLVRLGLPRETTDEAWLVQFAPWSFSAELYDRSRHVLIDIADASSLTVELRGGAFARAPQLLEIFASLEIVANEI